MQGCLSRIGRLFPVFSNAGEEGAKGICFLSHFLEYRKIAVHFSKSSPGRQEQWLQGFTGPLYIRGDLQPLVPLLALCSEWHAGNQLSNSMGYYSLHTEPRQFFDRALADTQKLMGSIRQQCDESDYLQAYLAGFPNAEDCEKHLFQKVSDILHTGSYQPQPAETSYVPKSSGGLRLIEKLVTEDEIVQQFLYEQIKGPFNRLFSAATIGFRKGLSRKSSARLLEQAIEEGFHYIIHTDIEDYFPSVNHNRLATCIRQNLALADQLTCKLLLAAVGIPVNEQGRIKERTIGLAQGSPLSPLLANLYLDSFDEYLSTLPVRFIRYVDDLLILCRTEAETAEILESSGHFLNELGLHLKKEKTFVGKATDPFLYLGLQFEGGKLQETDEQVQDFKKKPLFVTEPYAYLAFHRNSIEIFKNRKLISSIPLLQISAIMLQYQVVISGILVSKCLQAGIPVTLTLANAYHLTTIKPNTKTYHDILTLHGFAYYNASEGEILAIARQIAATKFENLLPLFRQRYNQETKEVLNYFREGISRIYQAQHLDQLRGQEGQLTRGFYRYFNKLVQDPDFILPFRDRRGNDPMNALLNFCSYLMMAKINSAIRAIGLNPYLGFLHSAGNNYESLVYDILELFRGRLYRLLLRLIHLKIIQAGDFDHSSGSAYLLPDARRRFIAAFEKELNLVEKIDRLTLREQIYAQVIILKNWACDQKSLTFYQWRV